MVELGPSASFLHPHLFLSTCIYLKAPYARKASCKHDDADGLGNFQASTTLVVRDTSAREAVHDAEDLHHTNAPFNHPYLADTASSTANVVAR